MIKKPNFQNKEKAWRDEQGIKIPANRLSKAEKLAEKTAERLYKQAEAINKSLAGFKEAIDAASLEVMTVVYAENDADVNGSKGNFTWYNFDRSLKVEVSVQQRTDFDETLIQLCQDKLKEFLDTNIQASDDFIKQFVTDAFAKSKGGLDAKKVMSLLRYRSKVKNPLFQQALDLLEKSVRHPDSKRYYRLFVRGNDGEYNVINLNFSAI